MGALKVIPPITITDSILLSSSVPETDYAAWNSGTTYSIGNRVILTSTHKIYESLQNSNLNKNPVTETTYWLEVSSTNRWGMFDLSNSSATTSSSNIVVTLKPNKVINSVALIGLVAVSVRIKMTDPTDGIVYDQTYILNDNGTINDWWEYYFTEISRKDSLIVTDLPSYGTASIEITINKTSTTASCATCVIGNMKSIGEGIELGASVGIQDYSRKEIDSFGNFIIVQRNFAKRAKFSLPILNTQIDSVQRLLASLRTTPCVWIGDDNYACTQIFGFYKDFDIVINYHVISDCSLEIEGLT